MWDQLLKLEVKTLKFSPKLRDSLPTIFDEFHTKRKLEQENLNTKSIEFINAISDPARKPMDLWVVFSSIKKSNMRRSIPYRGKKKYLVLTRTALILDLILFFENRLIRCLIRIINKGLWNLIF